MALTTRSLAKTHLGIAAGDTSEDAAIDLWIGGATAAVRGAIGQQAGDLISANSAANPTVVTCIAHGLETGDSILVAHSNSTPTIDGARTVTRIDDHSFSVPVNVTVAGTAGTFSRQYTEFYEGSGGDLLLLNQRPVQLIGSVYLDPDAYYGEATGAFGSATLLTAGSDYALRRDHAASPDKSKSGMLVKIGGIWPRPLRRTAGLLTAAAGLAAGNIKVTYTAGFTTLPPDLVLAVNQLAAALRRSAPKGGPIVSERYDYYSYQLASDPRCDFSSIRTLLARYRPLVF